MSLNDSGYLRTHDYIQETAYSTNDAGLANSSARLLPPRAVVFSRDATIGLCAITTVPLAVSQHFIAWLCGDRIIPEYLLLALKSMEQEFERLSMGATIGTLGVPEVRALAIPVPPLPEQEAIIAQVKGRTSEIGALATRVQSAIALLREYRAALIHAAVTGKIDVREEVA